ncbi:hypothetical protein Hanom_Chr14g01272361 [Helianthus anomalus]
MPHFSTVPAPHILPSFRQAFPTTPTAFVFTSSLANTEHTRSRSTTRVPPANVFTQNTIPHLIKLQISSFSRLVTVVTNPDQLSGKPECHHQTSCPHLLTWTKLT